MKNYQVYVISKTGKPLMPTKRFRKVRKLLGSGQAKVVSSRPFTIQLLYESKEYTQKLVLGIDPGAKHIACVVRKEEGEVVYASELEVRSREVSENMEERRMYRRGRRNHRRLKRQRRAKRSKNCFEKKLYSIAGMKEKLECKLIKPKLIRFHNRKRPAGWLTPTATHLLQSHKNLIGKIKKILPIGKVRIEFGKFDLHKINKPEIKGKEYQEGKKKGFVNLQEYVLCRDEHTCQWHKKKRKKVPLHVHHVVWRREGGADSPENLVTLCKDCHEKVHKNPKFDAKVKKLFKGTKKRFVHTTLLNTIMPSLHNWLKEEFKEVSLTYGYETKHKRRKLGLEKEHSIDAYLISFEDEEKITKEKLDFSVYQVRQFRRHHRQIIHAVRDRNYKDGKTIVAKNRHKRMGQAFDSIEELVAKKGKEILSRLRVLPGKKVKRSQFDQFRKGDTVLYKGKRQVVKGYGEMGRRLGFVNEKNYVLTKDCQLLSRNSGMVYL